MNQQNRRVFPGSPIPRRPSRSPEQSPSLLKRSTILPVHQSSEQPPSPPDLAKEEIDEVSEATQSVEIDGVSEATQSVEIDEVSEATQSPEQPPSLPETASVLPDKVDNRSLLAEMATVKSEALPSTVPLVSKNGVSSYAADVHWSATQSKMPSREDMLSEEKGAGMRYPEAISDGQSRKRRYPPLVIPF